MRLIKSILILPSLLLLLTSCSALTTTEYDYYPIPSVYLKECDYDKQRPLTNKQLLAQYKQLKICAKRGNEDKQAISAIVEGSLFGG